MNLRKAAEMAVRTCEAEDLPPSSEASITHLKDVLSREQAGNRQGTDLISALVKIDKIVGEFAYKSPEQGYDDMLVVTCAEIHKIVMEALREDIKK